MSDAVTVELPALLSVTLNVLVPATSAALAGSVAFGSLEVIDTVSVVLMTFQFASTARMVTLKAEPADWTVGVPVLPLIVPGAALSPGTTNCNPTRPPALTGIAAVVLAVLLPSVASVAVKVALPAVF